MKLRYWREREGVFEQRVQIPMPWRSKFYCMNVDSFIVGRCVLLIAWYVWQRALFVRVGLTHRGPA